MGGGKERSNCNGGMREGKEGEGDADKVVKTNGWVRGGGGSEIGRGGGGYGSGRKGEIELGGWEGRDDRWAGIVRGEVGGGMGGHE